MIAQRLPALVLVLTLAACQQQEMADQPKLRTYAKAAGFESGSEARPLPAGTVARDDSSSQDASPPKVDMALLKRGQERFGVFCSPCHGYAGYGDGIVVERGFPAPPSFHGATLRAMSAQQIVDTITSGYGVMYSYAGRVPLRDRWAIAAYVRALQLSQVGAEATGGGS